MAIRRIKKTIKNVKTGKKVKIQKTVIKSKSPYYA